MFVYIYLRTAKIPTVQVRANLNDYFTACMALYQEPKTRPPTARLEELAQKFHQARDLLVSRLSGILGAMPWLEAKKLFRNNCDPKDALCSMLNDEDSSTPAAIATLDAYFIELLTNSIDALLHQVLSGTSNNTQLTMQISLQIEKGRLQIQISDNAGGFPLEFLRQHQTQQNRGKKDSGVSDKAASDYPYYLGGQKKGIRIFQETGITVDPSSTITFENTSEPEEPGAKITLCSSIKPPVGSLNLEPRPLATPSTVLSPPPQRRRPKEDSLSPLSTRKDLLSESPTFSILRFYQPEQPDPQVSKIRKTTDENSNPNMAQTTP